MINISKNIGRCSDKGHYSGLFILVEKYLMFILILDNYLTINGTIKMIIIIVRLP